MFSSQNNPFMSGQQAGLPGSLMPQQPGQVPTSGINYNILAPIAPKTGVIANLPVASGGGGDDIAGGIAGLLSGLKGGGGGKTGGSEPNSSPHGAQSAQGAGPVNNSSVSGNASPTIGGGGVNQIMPSSPNGPAGNQIMNQLQGRPQQPSMAQSAVQKSLGPVSDSLKNTPAYQTTLQAYDNAKQQGITKSPYMTVVDFSKPSNTPRMWVVDPTNNQVMMQTYVSQGAPGFSNNPGSHQSSLGTYITGATYSGQHGPSLRVQGLDIGINDNAASRDIVVHPADYAQSGGRSFGCFGVPPQDAVKFAQLTAGGSIIHAWAPDSPGSMPKDNNFLTNPSSSRQILNTPGNNPFRPQQGAGQPQQQTPPPIGQPPQGAGGVPQMGQQSNSPQLLPSTLSNPSQAQQNTLNGWNQNPNSQPSSFQSKPPTPIPGYSVSPQGGESVMQAADRQRQALVNGTPDGNYPINRQGNETTDQAFQRQNQASTQPFGMQNGFKVDNTYSGQFQSRPRAADESINKIIVHDTGGGDFNSALNTLKERGLSYHYLIDRNGHVANLVNPNQEALHAKGFNQGTIGVSLVGGDHAPATPQQQSALTQLSNQLHSQYPGITNISGHQDNDGRHIKTDPHGVDFNSLRQQTHLSGNPVSNGQQLGLQNLPDNTLSQQNLGLFNHQAQQPIQQRGQMAQQQSVGQGAQVNQQQYSAPQQQVQQGNQNMNSQTLDLIRGFEGYAAKPYWDVNAYRTGYGSDTVTRADGKIEKVTPTTQISREDADRDLARRTQQFENNTRRQVGDQVWSTLTPNAQAALTSIAYNYGSIPKRILPQVKSGDLNSISHAIRGLAGDNKGVNRDRRNREAALVMSPSGQKVSMNDTNTTPLNSSVPHVNDARTTWVQPQNIRHSIQSVPYDINSNMPGRDASYVSPPMRIAMKGGVQQPSQYQNNQVNPPAIPKNFYDDAVRMLDNGRDDYSQAQSNNNIFV